MTVPGLPDWARPDDYPPAPPATPVLDHGRARELARVPPAPSYGHDWDWERFMGTGLIPGVPVTLPDGRVVMPRADGSVTPLVAPKPPRPPIPLTDPPLIQRQGDGSILVLPMVSPTLWGQGYNVPGGWDDATQINQALITQAGARVVLSPDAPYLIQTPILWPARNGPGLFDGNGGATIQAQPGFTGAAMISAPNGTIGIPLRIRGLILNGGNGKVNSAYAYTATSASPCVLTATGTSSALGPPSYANGAAVQLTNPPTATGSPPAGFTNATTYYVVNAGNTVGNSQSFSLAATPGGPALASTSTGNGAVTQNPVQPNLFDGINFAQTTIRFQLIGVTIQFVPQDGLSIAGGSQGGAFARGVVINHAYRHGFYLPAVSDYHFVGVEAEVCGQNGVVVGGTQGDWTNVKTNTCGELGLGPGTQDGYHLTGGSNNLIHARSENCAPALGSGNGFYCSGNRDNIIGFASGANGSLLYLDGGSGGGIGNDIDLAISDSTNNAQPAYVYTVNGAAKQNKVRIHGQKAGTVPATAYANLTNNGSEDANDFECEQESATGSQTIAYQASFATTGYTPDPYLGGTVNLAVNGAVVVNLPANGHAGTKLYLRLLQDATGHAVTFNAAYKISAAIPTTASTATVIGLALDSGGTWREFSRATA